MIKIDSHLIQNLLTRKDCTQYLSHSDILELSLCARSMYSKCAKLLFKSLDLLKDIDSQEQIQGLSAENYYDETLLKQMFVAQERVIKYKKYISSIYVNRNYNYFTVANITQYLPHLSQLSLYNLAIPTTSFKLILDNLPNLTDLSIYFILFAYPYQNKFNFGFKFPNSMKRFRCVDCHQMEYKSIHPLGYSENSDELFLFNYPILDFSNLKFDKLDQVIFHYDGEINANDFNRFLRNNDSIKTIDTQINCLNNDSFTLFSTKQNLTKLSISFAGSDPSEPISTLPILNNVRQLYIEPNIYKLELSHSLIKSCPNLERLIYNYEHELQPKILLPIESLKQLKKVIIINFHPSNVQQQANFPLSNVEYIMFHTFDPFSIRLSKFSHLRNLKNIKITVIEKDLSDKTEAIIKHFSEYNEWKVYIYKDTIQLWKF